MNKRNKILVGCLALLLVLSVGYALFSETITINGTATAKGDFDITYTCSVVEETTTINNAISVPKSTGNGSCVIENNIIKTTSTLNKPSDAVSYHIVLTNEGSIPAVLKTVDSSNNSDETLNSTGDAAYFDKTNLLLAQYAFALGQDSAYMTDSETENAKITLQSGETLDLVIMHQWADSEMFSVDTQPAIPENGVTINYNMVLGFEQVSTN